MSLTRTTTFRLFLIYALLLAGSMSGLVYLNYWKSASYTATQADYNVNWQFAYFSALPRDQLLTRVTDHIRSEPRPAVNYYGVFSRDGRRLAGDIAVVPNGLSLGGNGIWVRPELTNGLTLPQQYMRTREMRLDDGTLLVISRNVDEMARLREYMLGGIAWSAAIVVIGGLIVGLFVSALQLRRVREIRHIAQKIAAGDLNARLSDRGQDEISWLSRILNHMLDEVARLMREVEGTCDGIAHDLRAPLGHVHSILGRMRTQCLPGEQHALVDLAESELDNVLKRFSAIVRISKLETKKRHSAFEMSSVTALCREVAELYEPVAAERSVELVLALEDVSPVRLDHSLMFEALANLVDNAVKYAPVGGHVRITTQQRHEGPQIHVIDDGPGIPDEEHAAVLQRFYRAAHTLDVPGTGLGLSLVQAVINLHCFGMTLSNVRPGLCVTLECWPRRNVWMGT